MWNDCLRKAEAGFQVDCQHRFEVVFGVAVDRPAEKRSGVMHHDVHTAPFADGVTDCPFHTGDVADVDAAQFRYATRRKNFIDSALAVLRSAVHYHDLRTGRRKNPGNTGADSLAGTRDDCNFPIQIGKHETSPQLWFGSRRKPWPAPAPAEVRATGSPRIMQRPTY